MKQTITMKTRLFCVVLFSILNIILLACAECEFPSYLTLASVWTAEYANRATLTVVFKSNIMDAMECPTPEEQCVKYERKCKEEREKGKYVVEHKMKGRDSTNKYPEYLCMQFIKISEYIVQFRHN